MNHPLSRQKEARQTDPAGSLALDLLVYAAAGYAGELEARTLAASGVDLGRAMIIWYQMCETLNGASETQNAARQVAQRFQDDMNTCLEADTSADHAASLSMARGLLLDLATGHLDRFEELWVSVVSSYGIEIIKGTVALMLGFARGVLDSRSTATT